MSIWGEDPLPSQAFEESATKSDLRKLIAIVAIGALVQTALLVWLVLALT